MKPSRTRVPRLPARARARPRTLARPKLGRRLPPALGVRGTETAPVDQAPPPAAAPERAAPPIVQTSAAPNAMVLRGGVWEVRFGGDTVVLEGSRGLRYIALLIRDARRGAGPLHAKELVALADGRASEGVELERPDEILDAVAQKQLLARLEEVAAERDRAVAVDDFARADVLDDEHERIVATLSRAAAPGARRRKAAFDDAAEKARKAVAKAISETIARLRSYPGSSGLADHLASTIRKGQWLSYAGNADWHIDFQPLPRK